MFKNISIKNFRGITNLAVGGFRKVNLLIGKNNCGKTSALEALFLASAPTNPELPLRINKFRGLGIIEEQFWHLLFNKFGDNHKIEIAVELQQPEEKRSLKIEKIAGNKIPIGKPQNLKSHSLKLEPTETFLKVEESYSNMSSRTTGILLQAMFQREESEPEKVVAMAQQVEDGIALDIQEKRENPFRAVFINSRTLFSDAAVRLNNLQIQKETPLLVKVLQQVEPSLVNLSLGHQGVIYCDIGLDRLIPLQCLGDGISRLLAIILAIWDMKGGVIMIDEIENGLYHSSLKILWNAVLKFAQQFDVQIFTTTHSMECVKALALSYPEIFQETEDAIRVYRIEREEEKFRAVDYDYPTLKGSLEDGWEVR
ncbi:MAG: ATP-binding protein [Candidatus Brocadiae bacterium]|nr:ATP-binding protein [Candidatus Brocadiia bacterium]